MSAQQESEETKESEPAPGSATALAKVVSFSAEHYFMCSSISSIFTIVSLILTIEVLKKRDSSTSNFEALCRNFTILSLLAAFTSTIYGLVGSWKVTTFLPTRKPFFSQ